MSFVDTSSTDAWQPRTLKGYSKLTVSDLRTCDSSMFVGASMNECRWFGSALKHVQDAA